MMPSWRPPHAYVPGKTPRHPEELFDDIKATADRIELSDIVTCQAWKSGLDFLADGYFWEAHEVLEAVWLACPPNAPEKLMVQAVIQTANAKLKKVMGREKACQRLKDEARRLSREAVLRARSSVLGINSLDDVI